MNRIVIANAPQIAGNELTGKVQTEGQFTIFKVGGQKVTATPNKQVTLLAKNEYDQTLVDARVTVYTGGLRKNITPGFFILVGIDGVNEVFSARTCDTCIVQLKERIGKLLPIGVTLEVSQPK